MAIVIIELNECPRGHGVQALSIGDRRLTSMKCCGSWQTVKQWRVDTEDILEAAAEIEFNAVRERAKNNRAKV